MSKLDAQMGLFAAIDWVAGHAENPETVQLIETFLPGTTGIGQQGWSNELQRFLNDDELHPLDDEGHPRRPADPVAFPLYTGALEELSGEGVVPEDLSPAIQARALFASTVLGQALAREPDLRLPGIPRTETIPDPLDALLNIVVTADADPSTSSAAGVTPRWRDRPLDSPDGVKAAFLDVQTRADYHELTRALVEAGKLPPEVGNQKPACTGSLRKLHGSFCTLLTTEWHPPYTVAQIANVLDPHNWPHLCDFFVSIANQPVLNPDRSRGWTRVLETVSSDETRWQMRTALKYWKGTTTTGGGYYVNYDLDDPRENDSDLVEVDAGYVWVLPSGDPTHPVTLRTCKQVRIRGLSTTATAALGCFMGWGDAMTQMFGDQVTSTKVKRTGFPPPSVDPDPAAATQAPANAAKDPSNAEILREAEKVELLDGWRGLMIDNVSEQMEKGYGLAADLAASYLGKWMDGMNVEDVKSFAAQAASETTKFATDMFTSAAGALNPTTEELDDSAKGNV